MNTVWSSMVQNVECLYTSRSLRFADCNKEKYISFFNLPSSPRILEIGCGPGALSQALACWYPDAYVHGTDRDSNFIEFAKANISGAVFSEEDATALSFADESFDVTVSNTVSEHIEPAAFFGEQYRVLKKGGVCLLLSVRRGIQHFADCIAEESEFEKSVWASVDKELDLLNAKIGVGAYRRSEKELPAEMERHGFKNISVEYIITHFTPDSHDCDEKTAIDIIESERATQLNPVNYLKNTVPHLITDTQLKTLAEIINQKFDKRIQLYKSGKKQWDTYACITMVLRGEK